MTTLTPDRSARTQDGVSRTTIRLVPDPAGDRARIRLATDSHPKCPVLRPMLLDTVGSRARVSLVPEGAMLLADDHIDLDIEVGTGTRLEIVEPAGTVAYDMRGRYATWDVRLHLGSGASLVWAGEPLVASAGADVRRSMSIVLAPDARLALRETLVLGRYGEWPGRVRQRTRVHHVGGAPVLVEDLDLDPVSAPALIGRHRVVSTVLLLAPPDEVPIEAARHDRFDLETGGILWRRLGTDVHATVDSGCWAAVR
ncbi:MAG: urease accessory protein [Pimelobacter sp.]|nr:urease accessory protein [Pimelobacter sp.]